MWKGRRERSLITLYSASVTRLTPIISTTMTIVVATSAETARIQITRKDRFNMGWMRF